MRIPAILWLRAWFLAGGTHSASMPHRPKTPAGQCPKGSSPPKTDCWEQVYQYPSSLPPSLGENAEVAFCTGWIICPVLAPCLPVKPAHLPNMLPGVTSPKNPSCSHPSLRDPCWGSLTESTWGCGCSVSLPLPRNRLPMVTRSSPHPSQVKLSLGVGKKPKVIFFLDH